MSFRFENVFSYKYEILLIILIQSPKKVSLAFSIGLMFITNPLVHTGSNTMKGKDVIRATKVKFESIEKSIKNSFYTDPDVLIDNELDKNDKIEDAKKSTEPQTPYTMQDIADKESYFSVKTTVVAEHDTDSETLPLPDLESDSDLSTTVKVETTVENIPCETTESSEIAESSETADVDKVDCTQTAIDNSTSNDSEPTAQVESESSNESSSIEVSSGTTCVSENSIDENKPSGTPGVPVVHMVEVKYPEATKTGEEEKDESKAELDKSNFELVVREKIIGLIGAIVPASKQVSKILFTYRLLCIGVL